MRVDVWKSTLGGSSFLLVREGVRPEVVVNPDALAAGLKGLRLFRRSVELTDNPAGIAIDKARVSRDLAQRGYAVHVKSLEPDAGSQA